MNSEKKKSKIQMMVQLDNIKGINNEVKAELSYIFLNNLLQT